MEREDALPVAGATNGRDAVFGERCIANLPFCAIRQGLRNTEAGGSRVLCSLDTGTCAEDAKQWVENHRCKQGYNHPLNKWCRIETDRYIVSLIGPATESMHTYSRTRKAGAFLR